MFWELLSVFTLQKITFQESRPPVRCVMPKIPRAMENGLLLLEMSIANVLSQRQWQSVPETWSSEVEASVAKAAVYVHGTDNYHWGNTSLGQTLISTIALFVFHISLCQRHMSTESNTGVFMC